eukprot:m.59113 g.59113  ORF g.59113 m.59113 type:complete len:162 (-) comp7898_c1_seq2:2416-2901(-)
MSDTSPSSSTANHPTSEGKKASQAHLNHTPHHVASKTEKLAPTEETSSSQTTDINATTDVSGPYEMEEEKSVIDAENWRLKSLFSNKGIAADWFHVPDLLPATNIALPHIRLLSPVGKESLYYQLPFFVSVCLCGTKETLLFFKFQFQFFSFLGLMNALNQ